MSLVNVSFCFDWPCHEKQLDFLKGDLFCLVRNFSLNEQPSKATVNTALISSSSSYSPPLRKRGTEPCSREPSNTARTHALFIVNSYPSALRTPRPLHAQSGIVDQRSRRIARRSTTIAYWPPSAPNISGVIPGFRPPHFWQQSEGPAAAGTPVGRAFKPTQPHNLQYGLHAWEQGSESGLLRQIPLGHCT